MKLYRSCDFKNRKNVWITKNISDERDSKFIQKLKRETHSSARLLVTKIFGPNPSTSQLKPNREPAHPKHRRLSSI